MQKQRLDFESIWLETILTGSSIAKEDIVELLERFKIRFTDKDWQREISAEEMGNVLISDVETGVLVPAVADLLRRKYFDKLSFGEAELIFKKISKCELETLSRLYLNISANQKLKRVVDEYIFQRKHPDEFRKEDIMRYILTEIYRMNKEVAKAKLQGYLYR